ncbi:MAG: nucleotide exchange factor GrpE [Desulfobacteraceae bacterium IS3]|nr:MAG: nucleotide exchange factor GrpE [Desulfobacteraceae bacterium IS3]
MSDKKTKHDDIQDDIAETESSDTENDMSQDIVSEESSEEEDGGDDLIKDLETKLEAAEQEVKNNYDRLLRVSAEFENYKKRIAREVESIRKFANESLMKELLPVADNLERAVASFVSEEKIAGITEGVQMTLKEIYKIFETCCVTPVESVGKPFDPAFHEAISQEISEQYPENTVVREFHKGYMIHDRLLRPAMVVVSKAKA